jgi:glycosyltransferase involved in cell wall biosynthesis
MRLVVAHSRLNTFGGGERALLKLLQYLSARHSVALWTSGYQPEATYPELATFPHRILHTFEWFTATPNADAVIALTFGARLLALRHPRTLCYIHTMRSRYLIGGARPDLATRRLLDRTAIQCAARLFTNSAYTAGSIMRAYQREAVVLAPGVDDMFFSLPPSLGRYALSVGRLAPEKGIERLLRWSSTLPIELIVAGAGDSAYTAHLRKIAGPRTRFAGPLTGAALYDLYAGCRYLAFLPYAEEFGLVALEAMAAGKPVIAIRDGALPELVVDNETGLLVANEAEFIAASTRLIADDALCLRLGQHARETARTFTWERFTSGIELAFQELMNGQQSMR